MMVGAMHGVGFGVLANLAETRGTALVTGAVVWGGLVFVISSFVGLPLAAAIFNRGTSSPTWPSSSATAGRPGRSFHLPPPVTAGPSHQGPGRHLEGDRDRHVRARSRLT